MNIILMKTILIDSHFRMLDILRSSCLQTSMGLPSACSGFEHLLWSFLHPHTQESRYRPKKNESFIPLQTYFSRNKYCIYRLGTVFSFFFFAHFTFILSFNFLFFSFSNFPLITLADIPGGGGCIFQ
jgi:hypothetical protein